MDSSTFKCSNRGGENHIDASRPIQDQKIGIPLASRVRELTTAAPVAIGEVAALEHEVGDHAVERGALVVQGLAAGAGALVL